MKPGLTRPLVLALIGAAFVVIYNVHIDSERQARELDALGRQIESLRLALERIEESRANAVDSASTAETIRGPELPGGVGAHRPIAAVEEDPRLLDELAERVAKRLTDPESPEFVLEGHDERLRAVFDEYEEARRSERMERWQEQRTEEARERVRRFSERLRLTAYQEEDLVSLYAETSLRVFDTWSQVRQGELSFAAARESTRETLSQVDASLTEILAKDQYEELKAVRAEEEPGSPWRRLVGPSDEPTESRDDASAADGGE